jgi:ADP-ribose pyrophosphatase
MSDESGVEVLARGKFLRLVRRDGWEYVDRPGASGAVFILGVTDEGRVLLTREYRVPVGKVVVGLPAGLVGDKEADESLDLAVRRELLEEAGFEARTVTFLTEGPTSAGLTSEVIAIMLATGLRKVAEGGGIEGESIQVAEVPLDEADAWLLDRVDEGCVVDPKVYAAFYFLARRAGRD